MDCFEILTTSGVVLFQRSYAPIPNVINSLIKDVFIEETVPQDAPSYRKDKYTLKWTFSDLGLIFVAVYQSLLHLSWIDKLLENVKALFTTLYRDQFKKPHTSVIDCPFDDYFDRQVQALEKSAGPVTAQYGDVTPTTELTPPSSAGGELNGEDAPPPLPEMRAPLLDKARLSAADLTGSTTTSTDATPIPTPDSSRPSSPAVPHLATAKGSMANRGSRKNRRLAATSAPGSREQSTSSKSKLPMKAAGKEKRRWDASGQMIEGEDEVLDYSAAPVADDTAQSNGQSSTMNVSQSSWGRKTEKGEVVLKELDEEMESIISSSKAQAPTSTTSSGGLVSSGFGAISGLFRNVVGGKQLTVADLAKPLKAMEDHLVKKNVALEAAARLCEAVKRDLLDTKTGSFQSVDASIRTSMEKAVTKIMTPSSSLDLLRSIAAVTSSKTNQRPYVISVVGVNGVGKSTTLSKLAFFLLHNNYRVLVCGADTFRSGAVEQLKVHVRNLQSLIASSSTSENPLGAIDIYERGYGKDPAHIARDAVAYAATAPTPFDIVLIDTAGRRHNDTRLMSSLEGFARLAKPDKIFQVAEALVGSDSVAQARHFDASFGPGRHLDGFIVSKVDTVEKSVGTIVSLVHATGVPVIAVGTGQHYGDLRTLSVPWATRLLMAQNE